ncbi:MAG: thioredoxin family protein [Bacteroidia bacterium]|nr:thioredoxin family protein [Bacteroidia bacterium]MDW8333603.1 thioredoxin family protein [Bacteroidia bacterium]
MTGTTLFNEQRVASAMSYAEYWALIEKLTAEGKTTGDDHSPRMLEYTRLNMQRLKRGDAQATVSPPLAEAIRKIEKPQIWIVLTEWWCGDAAQNIALFPKMAALNPKITLKFMLRDQNPDIMDAFLTNGARAIPKLIILDGQTYEVLAHWGPRPAPMQRLAQDYKAGKTTREEFQKALHLAYFKDQYRSLNEEMTEIFAKIA